MTVTINGPANAASSGSGTVTHTAGDLTANQVVIGNGTADLKTLGSLGTTTTVLHGNAAGAPTYGAVAIATDVSGLAAGVATFLATPSSANLLAALTDETGTGAAVFANTPTLVTPVLGAATGTSVALTGGAITDTQAVAATSTDGLVLQTSDTATAGAQKWSPRSRYNGSGWKTDATAGAQAVSWAVEVVPVQGAAAPTAQLTHSYSVNGGAYAPLFTVDSLRGRIFLGGTSSGIILDPATTSTLDLYAGGSTHVVRISGAVSAFRSGLAASSPAGAASSPDVYLMRGAAANWVFSGSSSLAANPPVAQTLSCQDASGTDIAGEVWTFRESRATGNAKGGGFQWQLGTVGASGTTLQTAATKLDLGATTDDTLTFGDAVNIAFNTTTGTKIGTGTTQKLSFYGATPIVQGTSVADPSGGAIIDAEARTAIIAVITRLEALGLIATV